MPTLIHRPAGWGHPYEQSEDERFPRKPVTGEEISVGAISKPKGAFKRVWWRWKIDNGDWQDLEAEAISYNRSEGDLWQSKIPPIRERGKLTYQLWGENDHGETFCGGEYEVDIPEWLAPDEFINISTEENKISTMLQFTDGLLLELSFFLNPSGHLTLRHQKFEKDADALKSASKRDQPEVNDGSFEKIGPYQINFDRKELTFSVQKDKNTLIAESQPIKVLITQDNTLLAIRRFIKTTEEEIFLGLGERFNQLDQAGEILDTRVFEQYQRQGSKTYIPVPFFLSSRGYGWFQNFSRKSTFDFSVSGKGQLTIEQEVGPDDDGEIVILASAHWEEITKDFTISTGKPALPPVWAFGLWMSSNEWHNQAEVLRQSALMKKHKIPATVLVIEAWSDEENFYIWNDAEYAPKPGGERFQLAEFTFPAEGKWPDPQGMVNLLHDKGLKVILWQIPVLKYLHPKDIEMYGENKQHDIDEAYMIEKGFCVQNPDGSPYRVPPIWFSNSLVWDVTNSEGVDWWLSKRQYLLDEIGIDGFKTDGGEHLWGDNLRFADGRTNAEMWNEYPRQYQQHYHDFANQHKNENATLFSRAGFTGSQSAPCHWAGDQVSTWDAFRSVLLAGQNLGISGVPFWGWDIGGFSGPIPSAELYLRSAAAATFAPIMQYHSEHNEHRPVSVDRTPWNIQEQTGEERVLPIFRKFANLRMNLMPYIYSEAVHSSRSGEALFGCPTVKFMDKKFLSYPYQFTCGRHILVAPVAEESVKEWDIYLPEGDWINFWDGSIVKGGTEFSVNIDLDTIPVFIKSGTILPFNLSTSRRFGGRVGNSLSKYETLAFIQFGELNSKFNYLWSDYVSGEEILISPEMDLEAIKNRFGERIHKLTFINHHEILA
ncbi:MAG: TIM-barrel domain-containing protein [Brevefilum sp.]